MISVKDAVDGEDPLPKESEAIEIIKDGLEGLFLMKGKDSEGQVFFGRERPEKINVAKPHAVYVAGLESAASDVLGKAKFRGWRYILSDGNIPFGEVEIGYDKEARVHRLVRVGGPDGAKATTDAVYQLSRESSLLGDYVLRFLKAASLAVAAVWLRSEIESELDKVILVAPGTAQSLLKGQEYYFSKLGQRFWVREDFVKFIGSMAGEKLESGDLILGNIKSLVAQEISSDVDSQNKEQGPGERKDGAP